MGYGLVSGYQCFGGKYRFHVQGCNQIHRRNPEEHKGHQLERFQDGIQNIVGGGGRSRTYLTELCGMMDS